MAQRRLANRPVRSRRSLTATTAILLTGLLAGCGQIGIPLGAPSSEITGSIGTPQKTDLRAATTPSVDPSDWEAVRRAVAAALASGKDGPTDWENPDTGSSGTITSTVALADGKEDNCRLFATTLNDYRGVRRFRGQICRRTNGVWQLVSVTPDDAALS